MWEFSTDKSYKHYSKWYSILSGSPNLQIHLVNIEQVALEDAERAAKTFTVGTRKMPEGPLQQRLAGYLFSYCITPHSTTGVCPAKFLTNH